MVFRNFRFAVIAAGILLVLVGKDGELGAQGAADDDLARFLADGYSREDTVARIASMGTAKIPLLLKWSRNPPPGLFERELNVGLADVFGRLQSPEGIPFLIQNIALERIVPGDAWTKADESVELQYPAAAALIRIGPKASRAVMAAYYERPMQRMDRVLSVFVVSRIPGIPESKEFLSFVEWEARTQLRYASRYDMGASGK